MTKPQESLLAEKLCYPKPSINVQNLKPTRGIVLLRSICWNFWTIHIVVNLVFKVKCWNFDSQVSMSNELDVKHLSGVHDSSSYNTTDEIKVFKKFSLRSLLKTQSLHIVLNGFRAERLSSSLPLISWLKSIVWSAIEPTLLNLSTRINLIPWHCILSCSGSWLMAMTLALSVKKLHGSIWKLLSQL